MTDRTRIAELPFVIALRELPLDVWYLYKDIERAIRNKYDSLSSLFAKRLLRNSIGTAILAFFCLLLWRRAEHDQVFSWGFWNNSPEDVRNFFWTLGAFAAAFVGLYGLYLANRRAHALEQQAKAQLNQSRALLDQTRLSEQTQITDPFARAIEGIGNKSKAVRMGAIYALERIAQDSERDFTTIFSTLNSFVRDNVGRRSHTPDDAQVDSSNRPGIDTEAATIVLERLINSDMAESLTVSFRELDLRGLEMVKMDFRRFDFSNADLSGSKLSSCNFGEIRLHQLRMRNAALFDCDLRDASFNFCDFRNSNFTISNFDRTSFFYCDLSSATFSSGSFENTSFQASTLNATMMSTRFLPSQLDWSLVQDLRQQQINKIKYFEEAPPLLPPGLALPPPQQNENALLSGL